MRQTVTEEFEQENRIDEQPEQPEMPKAGLQQQWVKTIVLNLIIAASVCMARAAMDYLVEGYGNSRIHQRDDYARGGYPF